jgi:hypothetical protein
MFGSIIGEISSSRFVKDGVPRERFDLFASDCKAGEATSFSLAVMDALTKSDNNFDKFFEKLSKLAERFSAKLYPAVALIAVGIAVRAFGENLSVSEELGGKVAKLFSNSKVFVEDAEMYARVAYLSTNNFLMGDIIDFVESHYVEFDMSPEELADSSDFSENSSAGLYCAFASFFRSQSFESAVKSATVLTESPVLVAVTAALAECYYGIPEHIFTQGITFIKPAKRQIVYNFSDLFQRSHRYFVVTKYQGHFKKRENRIRFFNEFIEFMAVNSHFNPNDYKKELSKNGLGWSDVSLKNADTSKLSENTVLAIIAAVFKAEQFAGGVLDSYIDDGYIEAWIKRLYKFDESRPAPAKAVRIKKLDIQLSHKEHTESFQITAKTLAIFVSIPGVVAHAHQYEFSSVASQSVCEFVLRNAALALASDEWVDLPGYSDGYSFEYTLTAKIYGGETISKTGYFDRAHMPQKQFLEILTAVNSLCKNVGFGDVISIQNFLSAIKPGEVKYCDVEFSSDGKTYCYRTSDLRIMEGDQVVVPVGDENQHKLATVVSCEYYNWDDTPFPIEKTKEIIRPAYDTPPNVTAGGLSEAAFYSETLSDDDDEDFFE